MTLRGRLERWATEEGDPYVVSLVRAIVGGLLGYETGRRIAELVGGGYFGHVYHLPLWPEAVVPSQSVYVVALGAQMVLAALIVLGLWPRPALFLSSILGIFLLGCDRLQYHNNRYALLVLTFLLSFTPCGARWTVRRRAAGPDRAPLWAQRLAQLQVSIIYLASGGSKLLDADWRGGLVLGDRIHRYTEIAVTAGAPRGLVTFLAQPQVAEILSKVAIGTEVGLAFALWSPRLRYVALWWGVWFHLTIHVTTTVDIFTWLTITTYALFANPTTRERTLEFGPAAARWAKVVGMLDWLHRFAPKPLEKVSDRERSLRLIDRDGRVATGFDAWVLACRTLPLLFPLWAPMAVLARVRSAIPRAVVRGRPAEP